MTTKSHSFKVGKFECIAVNDGNRKYPYDPIDWLYPDAPKDELFAALRKTNIQPEKWEVWISPYTCLVVNSGSHQVLVDTGAGKLDTETGNLIRILSENGIEADSIDTVIFTHAHPDHIGGNLDSDGKPAFPNARHVMWKKEYEFWIPEGDLSTLNLPEDSRQRILNFPKECLPPIRKFLDLIDDEVEIVPGIHAVAAHGHTPGHMAVAVSSGEEHLLVVGDAFVQPVNVEHPEWTSLVDLLPDQTVATRRHLCEWAVANKALLLAFHFPFPGLGHITGEKSNWKWHPIGATG